jgi:hypothetical protein
MPTRPAEVARPNVAVAIAPACIETSGKKRERKGFI